jgi:hypothetical protein
LYIAAALDSEGFTVAQSNVRLRDGVFYSGSVYKRRPLEPGPDSLVARMANALTEDEANQVVKLLYAKFPRLEKPRS